MIFEILSWERILFYLGSFLAIILTSLKIYEIISTKPRIKVDVRYPLAEIYEGEIEYHKMGYLTKFKFDIKLYNIKKEKGVLRKIVLIVKNNSKYNPEWYPQQERDIYITEREITVNPIFDKVGYFTQKSNPIKLKLMFSNHKTLTKKVIIPNSRIIDSTVPQLSEEEIDELYDR